MDERSRDDVVSFRAHAGIIAVFGTAAVGLGIYCLFTGTWTGAWFCLPVGVGLLTKWVLMMRTGHGG